MVLILVVLLVLMIVGCAPWYPYSRGWGPYPASGLGLVLLVVLILLLFGVIPVHY